MSDEYREHDEYYDDNDEIDTDNYNDDDFPSGDDLGDSRGSAPVIDSSPKPASALKFDGTFNGEFDDNYRAAVLEQIRLAKIRRARADKRAKDKLHAEIVVITVAVLMIVLICSVIIHIGKRKREASDFVDSSSVSTETRAPVTTTVTTAPPEPEPPKPFAGEAEGHNLEQKNGVTYIDGILIVNKTFPLPKDFAPGLSQDADNAFYAMAAAAWADNIGLWINSGYRTYAEQDELFCSYADMYGLAEADEFSARPGHSEHQTGLCFDINTANTGFIGTNEAYWVEQHCAEFGFIVRFPQGKEHITGYDYEPWHLRYVGVDLAQKLKASGQCLEEYLNITSKYENAPNDGEFLKDHPQYKATAAAPADSSSAGQ